MAKKTTKPVKLEPEEKEVETPEKEVETPEKEVETKTPKDDKKCRVVGIYDGQQIARIYEDAKLAKQFCDKINNSGRNENSAKLV